jgi:hypothetical protein
MTAPRSAPNIIKQDNADEHDPVSAHQNVDAHQTELRDRWSNINFARTQELWSTSASVAKVFVCQISSAL